MKKLIGATIFTLLLIFSNFAQVYTDRDFQAAPQKETKYDKFEDQTTTSLKFQETRNFSITFEDTFNGKVRKSKITKLRLSFLLFDPDLDYLSSSCIFLADDNRIRLEDGSILRAYGGEAVSFSITIEDFKKIANAKKVEMKIGSRGSAFTQSRLDALKEFYKELVP